MVKQELEKLINNEAEKFRSIDGSTNYLNIFKSGASFVSEILMAEIEKLGNIKILYHALIHEWDETCEEDCDSYAHNELCKNVDLGNAKRSLNLEVDSLKVKLNTCKHDYNFMINLIELYGSDKDQILKDCLERMKLSKPLFEEK